MIRCRIAATISQEAAMRSALLRMDWATSARLIRRRCPVAGAFSARTNSCWSFTWAFGSWRRRPPDCGNCLGCRNHRCWLCRRGTCKKRFGGFANEPFLRVVQKNQKAFQPRPLHWNLVERGSVLCNPLLLCFTWSPVSRHRGLPGVAGQYLLPVLYRLARRRESPERTTSSD